MRSLEKEGKTVDEAIWKGLQELGLSRDRVRIEILDQGSRGLFGLGARPARVLLLENEIEEELDIRGILLGKLERTTEPEKPREQPAAPTPRPASESTSRKPPQRTDSSDPRRAAPPSSSAISRKDRGEMSATEITYPFEPRSEASQRIAEQLQRQQTTLPSRSVDHLKTPRQDQNRPRRAPQRQDSRSSSRMSSVRPPKDLAAPSEGSPALLHTFLTELLQAMELPCSIGITQEDNILQASVYGEGDDLGLLIGKHGATLDSLQYLSSLAVNRGSEGHLRVQIQIGDYRQRREDTLMRLANRVAEKVLRDGEPQALEPMLASERRIIHLALQEHSRVETLSEGEEPNRYVVVRLKQA